MMWDVQKLLGQLPQPVVTILRQATPTLLEQMTEIRLRSGQPLVVTVGERTLFLSKSGTVVPAEQGFIIPQELVQETMLSLCGHSLHGIEKTLEQGFFTAQGGFRIGVCMQPYAPVQISSVVCPRRKPLGEPPAPFRRRSFSVMRLRMNTKQQLYSMLFSAGCVLWSRYIVVWGRSHFTTLCCVD